MNMSITTLCGLFFLTILPTLATAFTLSSQDIAENELMNKQQEFNGFGCNGENKSPQLSWFNPPKGTKSFAITVYDPDAPTGSGWWHWQLVNIPKTLTSIDSNAGSPNNSQIPPGSTQIKNDYGFAGFGGACPPAGHGTHHYRFTVHALSIEKIDVTKDDSGALVGYMINTNTIETSTLESLYIRK